MTTKIMLDLETLGTSQNSVILSIGAVKFDQTGIIDTFEMNVDAESCVRHGMKMDAGTLMWWMKQPEKARESFEKRKIDIDIALIYFRLWSVEIDELWGNGVDFDNAILANAYDLCGEKKPWKYTANRCYRTVKSLCPDVPVYRIGVHHNCLDDAKTQALHLNECLRSLGKI